jgi:hypothetical protein
MEIPFALGLLIFSPYKNQCVYYKKWFIGLFMLLYALRDLNPRWQVARWNALDLWSFMFFSLRVLIIMVLSANIETHDIEEQLSFW